MCIILVGKIGMERHQLAKTQNSHGFSLFTKSQGLIKAPKYEDVRRAVNQFGIWHYRIASSGKVDENNIHPFPVADGKAYLYHNGVLGAGTAKMSDTACLAKTLEHAPLHTVKSVLKALSHGQRFLLVSADNPQEYLLYGDWVVDQGVIMSHTLYSYRKYSTLSTAQKNGWDDLEDGYLYPYETGGKK